MIHIKDFKEGKTLYEALDSDIRMGMLNELLYGTRNLDYFAKKFNVSNGAITAHARKLLEAGLIEITETPGIRGTQKVCRLTAEKLIIDFNKDPQPDGKWESVSVDVGHYAAYEVHPTCGLAMRDRLIGALDRPASFSMPDAIHAGVLWFSFGYVEYAIPNPTTADDELLEIQFTMEISSEAPGTTSVYPSDIHFFVNGHALGYYTSHGEYSDRPGLLNPAWWKDFGQYGKKILIAVNGGGTFIQGAQVSEMKISDLEIKPEQPIRLRVSVPREAVRRGGATLFGRGFGDYDEGIVCNFICKFKQ